MHASPVMTGLKTRMYLYICVCVRYVCRIMLPIVYAMHHSIEAYTTPNECRCSQVVHTCDISDCKCTSTCIPNPGLVGVCVCVCKSVDWLYRRNTPIDSIHATHPASSINSHELFTFHPRSVFFFAHSETCII